MSLGQPELYELKKEKQGKKQLELVGRVTPKDQNILRMFKYPGFWSMEEKNVLFFPSPLPYETGYRYTGQTGLSLLRAGMGGEDHHA